jgi:ornithine cyclodeaminase/alanine dehydrogenase-like protein (mu-crystallin family)
MLHFAPIVTVVTLSIKYCYQDVEAMETLLLTASYIGTRVPASRYLAGVEQAFVELAAGDLEAPAVGHLGAREGGAFHVKAAARRHGSARAVIKVNGNFPLNPDRLGLPTIQGFIALLDAGCGRILALMDSAEITARRTAAASALAARALALPHASRLAIVGCGVQARHHLEALRELFAFESVLCHDSDRARAEALVATAGASDIGAGIAASAREAARDAHIVVTCTTSTRPLLRHGDVAPGAFIAAVGADNPGKQEIDPGLMRAARVVPDVLAQAVTLGDLHHAVAAGVMAAADIHAELADIVSGRVPGRRSDAEIFVFDSTGTAIEDLAAAELVYEIACADASAPRVRFDA